MNNTTQTEASAVQVTRTFKRRNRSIILPLAIYTRLLQDIMENIKKSDISYTFEKLESSTKIFQDIIYDIKKENAI